MMSKLVETGTDNQSDFRKCMNRTASDLNHEVKGLEVEMACTDSQLPFAFITVAALAVLALIGYGVFKCLA